MINSERAKELDAYIQNNGNKEEGKWPLEIGGEKQIKPFYKFPLSVLRYNRENGRLGMEVRQWEQENKRTLDEYDIEDAKIIRGLLKSFDQNKFDELRNDILSKTQMEPGVVTNDGIVINGNRRLAVLESLNEEFPTGKWAHLEAIRLPPNITSKDLWRIEAGLQLSKDRVAEYHPMNELLKIQDGVKAGLSHKEIAAAMYGWTEDEVERSLKRLELIVQFLTFMGQPNNFGAIKKYRLNEHFIDLQDAILAKNEGLSAKEKMDITMGTFALIRASILLPQGKKRDNVTHSDIRRLGKIFQQDDTKATFLDALKTAKSYQSVPPEIVVQNFKRSNEIISLRAERDRPLVLITTAQDALKSIDTDSEHFKSTEVRNALNELSVRLQQLLALIPSENNAHQ